MNIEFKPYTKLIVIKIDHFGSKIVDEKNFGNDEVYEMRKFKHKYIRDDNCTIVSIDM